MDRMRDRLEIWVTLSRDGGRQWSEVSCVTNVLALFGKPVANFLHRQVDSQ